MLTAKGVGKDLIHAIHDCLPEKQTMTADEIASAVGGKRWAPTTIRQAVGAMAHAGLIVVHRGKMGVRFGRFGSAPNPQTPGGWSDEAEAALRELWSQGLSASEIARRLGGHVSRDAVIGKAHRMGLERRASPIIREGVIVNGRRQHVPLRKTDPDGCRFATGEPERGRFLFCNAAVHRPGSAWCAEHRTVVYDKAGRTAEPMAAE